MSDEGRSPKGAAPDRLPGPDTKVTAEQAEILARRAISPADATSAGVIAVQTKADLPDGCPDYWTEANGYLPGLLFPYRSPDGETAAYQLRPDAPVVGKDGDVKKYVFGPNAPSILHTAKTDGCTGPLLIQEGTCQTIAAALYVPGDVDVYGIAGCQSWMKDGIPIRDLSVVDGRDVLIGLDADAASNPDVYAAGVALKQAVEAQGAESVKFLRVPGGRKTGLDDFLASVDDKRRAGVLANLIEKASAKPADRKPEAKKVSSKSDSSVYFEGEKLKAADLADAILAKHPAALTEERRLALYSGGVYRPDDTALTSAVTKLLGNDYRPAHKAAVKDVLVGRLYDAGLFLPTHMTEPLLNCANVMVDLRTGESLPHDPSYLSSAQLPIDWIPGATAPVYEQWLKDVLPDQSEDLEEVTSAMLDPSRTPTKAAFLFGPSRSGKSTYLRLMEAMVGPTIRSAVTLHQLSTDRFAAANVFGMVLNVASDLKAADVEDVSIFKMMVGDDPIQANRKYGLQFTFRNRALFAFGGNSLPPVQESSRAYSERIKPFKFDRSFAGREDPTIEAAMMRELPGLLVRWVQAWQRRQARGTWLPTDPSVREEFEVGSDRVRQFVASCCVIHPTDGGLLPQRQVGSKRELHRAFIRWADEQRGGGMAQSKFGERLASINGVREVRTQESKARGFNVTVRPDREWGQDDEVAGRGDEVAEVATSSFPSPDAGTHTPPVKEAGDECVPGGEKGWAETATSATSGPSELESVRCPVPSCGRPMLVDTSCDPGSEVECSDPECHFYMLLEPFTLGCPDCGALSLDPCREIGQHRHGRWHAGRIVGAVDRYLASVNLRRPVAA